jgi:subtilisin-like proprotein convertase family protein
MEKTMRYFRAAHILAAVLVLAMNANVTAQTVVGSSSPGAGIPDATCTGGDGSGGITDTIVFPDVTAGLTDVDVRVEIDQTFRGDLQFHVTYSGGGGTVILAADDGGAADDYYATFDDGGAGSCASAGNCGAGTACSAANAPGPTCTPDSALSAFNGLAMPGTFIIAVCDDGGGDLGTLVTWEVTATGPGLPVELLEYEVE